MTTPQTELEKDIEELSRKCEHARRDQSTVWAVTPLLLEHVLLAAKRVPELEQRVKEVEKENEGLKETVGRASSIHIALESVLGCKCLPSQTPRFTADKLSALRASHKEALDALKRIYDNCNER